MKRIQRALVVSVLILTIMLSIVTPALASQNAITVFVDGNRVRFDVPPIIEGGRTFVPMRAIFTSLGYSISWSASEKSIRAVRSNNSILMHIGSRLVQVSGFQLLMDVEPMIRGGRTYVPLRFVGEASGCAVRWNANARRIDLTTSRGSIQPPTGLSGANEFEREVFRLVNVERQRAGLKPLTWNTRLAIAAYLHSLDMSNRGYFSHNSPDGTTPPQRTLKAGYSYSFIGENIARGYTSPEAVMRGWMNSAGHRANILHPNYNDIGVGIAATGQAGGQYWTQNFGSS